MELMIASLLLGLVSMGMFVCALYFCLCLQPKEHDRNAAPERINPSAPSASENDFSQVSATYPPQEFHHLFPTDHVNSVGVDRTIYHSSNDQRIPFYNENGFNQSEYGFVYPSTSSDYTFHYTSNIDNGFIYPTNHGVNTHGTSQYSSMNSGLNFNQTLSSHGLLKKIETPPPSYYEALGYNPSDNIHRRNPITCERKKCRHSVGASGDGRTGSRSHFEAVVDHNHSFDRRLIVRNTCESRKSPSVYCGRRGGGRGIGRNGSGYSGGSSGENNTIHSNLRDSDRNTTGYISSSSRVNSGAYSCGRSGGNSSDYNNERDDGTNVQVHRSSRGDSGGCTSGGSGGNGTGRDNRDGITCDGGQSLGNHGRRDFDGGIIGSGICSDANCIEIKILNDNL